MSTSTYGAVTNQTDLSSIIVSQSLATRWGLVRREAQLVTTLASIENNGLKQSIRAKSPQWAADDYPDETVKLSASLAYNHVTNTSALTASAFYSSGTAAGTAAHVGLDEKRFEKGDIIYMNDKTAWVTLRLGDFASGTGPYLYAIEEVLDGSMIGSPATITFSAGQTCVVLASGVNYDGAARSFLNVRASTLTNQMQRSRDTVGKGKLERSELFLVDNSLEHMQMLGFKAFAKKQNKSLYVSSKKFAPTTGGDDRGLTGGFPYFLDPQDAETGYASSTYKGVNRVDTGTNIDYGNIVDYSASLFAKGGLDKFCFANSSFSAKFLRAIRTEVQLTQEKYMNVAPEFARIAENVVTFETGFGKMWFHVDRGVDGVRQELYDDTTTTRQADTINWMLCLDPTQVGIVYLDAIDLGVMVPTVVPVFKERNNSIDEVEFDAAWMLWCRRPDTCGYYGITNV